MYPRYVHKTHKYQKIRDMKNTETCHFSEISGDQWSQTSQNDSSNMKIKLLHYASPIPKKEKQSLLNFFIFYRKYMWHLVMFLLIINNHLKVFQL